MTLIKKSFQSLTTLIVENLFAEMQEGNKHASSDTIFVQTIVNCARAFDEKCKMLFNYYTSLSSYCSTQGISPIFKATHNCSVVN